MSNARPAARIRCISVQHRGGSHSRLPMYGPQLVFHVHVRSLSDFSTWPSLAHACARVIVVFCCVVKLCYTLTIVYSPLLAFRFTYCYCCPCYSYCSCSSSSDSKSSCICLFLFLALLRLSCVFCFCLIAVLIYFVRLYCILF